MLYTSVYEDKHNALEDNSECSKRSSQSAKFSPLCFSGRTQNREKEMWELSQSMYAHKVSEIRIWLVDKDRGDEHVKGREHV